FLRFSTGRDQGRLRPVLQQILPLREQVQEWATSGNVPVVTTAHYIDLVFAFGLARLGERSECDRLAHAAVEALGSRDEVHSWLCRAYVYRVRQALDGTAATGRLPEELLHELQQYSKPAYLKDLAPDQQKQESDRLRMDRLRIDRLREYSRIL